MRKGKDLKICQMVGKNGRGLFQRRDRIAKGGNLVL